MKILHIIPSVAKVRGGPTPATLHLVKSLRDVGIDAEIATTNDNGNELLNVPLNQCSKFEGIPVWFFSKTSSNFYPITEYSFSAVFTQWLWKHIDEYDLVHIHAVFSYPCTIAALIARIKKIPYIVRPNGLLCSWSLQQSRLKKKLYMTIIERANINSSNAIEFTSNLEKYEVSSLGLTANSFVLPYAISPAPVLSNARNRLRKLLQVPTDEPVILFMSRLHPKKGLEYLIPALGKLVDRPFTFVLAGSGSPSYETEIDNLLSVHKLKERTYCPGFVEGETKELLLQGADIFTLTSYSESFGLAVLEGIANGLSIIVTPTVPLSTVVEQHQLGYVTELKTDSITAILETSLRDLQDSTIVNNRKSRSKQLIETQYSWKNVTSNLIEVYHSILESSS